jgi:hypothetical protein
MLADQHHGALEKRTSELSAVEQQLTLQKFWLGSHRLSNVPQNGVTGKSVCGKFPLQLRLFGWLLGSPRMTNRLAGVIFSSQGAWAFMPPAFQTTLG